MAAPIWSSGTVFGRSSQFSSVCTHWLRPNMIVRYPVKGETAAFAAGGLDETGAALDAGAPNASVQTQTSASIEIRALTRQLYGCSCGVATRPSASASRSSHAHSRPPRSPTQDSSRS